MSTQSIGVKLVNATTARRGISIEKIASDNRDYGSAVALAAPFSRICPVARNKIQRDQPTETLSSDIFRVWHTWIISRFAWLVNLTPTPA